MFCVFSVFFMFCVFSVTELISVPPLPWQFSFSSMDVDMMGYVMSGTHLMMPSLPLVLPAASHYSPTTKIPAQAGCLSAVQCLYLD